MTMLASVCGNRWEGPALKRSDPSNTMRGRCASCETLLAVRSEFHTVVAKPNEAAVQALSMATSAAKKKASSERSKALRWPGVDSKTLKHDFPLRRAAFDKRMGLAEVRCVDGAEVRVQRRLD